MLSPSTLDGWRSRKLHGAIFMVALLDRADLGRAAHVRLSCLKSFKLGGEGGWDYLNLDPVTGNLFITRGSHLMVAGYGCWRLLLSGHSWHDLRGKPMSAKAAQKFPGFGAPRHPLCPLLGSSLSNTHKGCLRSRAWRCTVALGGKPEAARPTAPAPFVNIIKNRALSMPRVWRWKLHYPAWERPCGGGACGRIFWLRQQDDHGSPI